MSKQNVLFLCTGNSCRSQMGEALVNHFKGDGFVGYSAGTKPTGYVHPLALEVLAEMGIDGAGLVSKSADSLKQITFHHTFTVCDNAATDCPVWLGEGTVTHIPFPDPADATGTRAERLEQFRAVRDAIQTQIVKRL